MVLARLDRVFLSRVVRMMMYVDRYFAKPGRRRK